MPRGHGSVFICLCSLTLASVFNKETEHQAVRYTLHHEIHFVERERRARPMSSRNDLARHCSPFEVDAGAHQSFLVAVLAPCSTRRSRILPSPHQPFCTCTSCPFLKNWPRGRAKVQMQMRRAHGLAKSCQHIVMTSTAERKSGRGREGESESA